MDTTIKTVLITGGAGFIGSHLCEKLLELNCTVNCIDNLITGSLSNIEHLLDNPKFHFINSDITSMKPYQFSQDCEIDAILHFASIASPKHYLEHPLETLLTGSLGTHFTLNLAHKFNARYVLASTSEVYGDPLESPQNESYWGNVNPIGLRSPYDEGKRYAEAYTSAYRRQFNLDTRIVRIFNTYGPRMNVNDGRMIPNFITQALRQEPITIYGDGLQTRSCAYIDDTIDGILKILFSPKETMRDRYTSTGRWGVPINIGNPTELSVLEIANTVKTLSNSKSDIQHVEMPTIDDPKKRQPDIDRAKQLLQWKPKIDLKKGLKRTIQYFKEVRNDRI